MSTFEDKVEVVYDFLANRASLKRLTNANEVGVVAGYTLKNRSQRRIDSPVRRDKITKVLAAVDRKSKAEKGVLLSAVVAHFWDNEVSRHFYDRANRAGVFVGSHGRSSATGITSYRDQVFAAYSGHYPVSQKPKPVYTRPSRVTPVGYDLGNGIRAERRGTTPTADRGDALTPGLRQFQERLQALTLDFDEYVGTHRAEAKV